MGCPCSVERRPDDPGPPTGPVAPHLFVALFDYEARTQDDLSFVKGDMLRVPDAGPDSWWYAWLVERGAPSEGGAEGWIPANYVARVQSIEAEPWFFGKISRADAVKLLLARGNDHGSFLIRESESKHGAYALSVRDVEQVRHYHIQPLEGGGFTINKRAAFSTLQDLVRHHVLEANGLKCALISPCVQVTSPVTFGLSHDTVDQWEVKRSSIELLRQLGAGQFGEVYEGLWNKTTRVAVKTLKPGAMVPEEFLAEAHIMKRFTHCNLIQLYAVCTTEEPIYIITELMVNGSLLQYLQNDEGGVLKMCHLINMAVQVASGMAYLEAQNYIHRDLAARNILVGDNLTCKVADFGLARVIKDDEYIAREGGKFPVKWTAPEAANYSRFTIKSDVWSFGILLYEIVTYGKVPYAGMTNAEVLEELEHGYRMPCPTNCPRDFYSIMYNCWHKEEACRPSFLQLDHQLEDLITDYSEPHEFLS
ncbi:tyrosine-protein kinase Src42A-like isoform X1 [Petromyzon marinus]|uniref:Tyrosine-protein kinase n=1 Tax=Petromyzon marinus TaxID=7757 RepID=A0AAJ7X5F5_PETMA|nr:tyrosine-protein kinase SRK2-like [Petromyzon marinus]